MKRTNGQPSKDVIDAIHEDVTLPLFSEGWFVAGIVTGATVGAVFFVFIGSVFFSGSVQPSEPNTRLIFGLALVIAFVSGAAGLWCYAQYSGAGRTKDLARRGAGLHRVVAVQRSFAALLLLFFGAAAIWQALAHAAWLGLLSLVLVTAQVGLGWRLVPRLLPVLAGRTSQTGTVLRRVDGAAAIGISLLGVVASLSMVSNASPGSFYLVLTQLLSALTVAWVPALFKVASIHRRAGRV